MGAIVFQTSELAQAAREEVDMAKILAIMNAHALAHVSRPLEIAKVMRNRDNEIIFAGHGKYLEIAAKDGFETIELPYISAEQVVEAVRSQRLDQLYKEEQITEYIEAELTLYKHLQPDLVLIDNRPTAVTSAELSKAKDAKTGGGGAAIARNTALVLRPSAPQSPRNGPTRSGPKRGRAAFRPAPHEPMRCSRPVPSAISRPSTLSAA